MSRSLGQAKRKWKKGTGRHLCESLQLITDCAGLVQQKFIDHAALTAR